MLPIRRKTWARRFPSTARALGYLKEICEIGPRISGSAGMVKQQKLLQTHFEKHGGKVSYQRFNAQQESRKEPVAMANMIVSWQPEKQRRIVFCGHYDTRPIADQEPERRRWTQPFVAANDSASVAAWMMELAHHMKDITPAVGIDFVLFDGEEYIFEPGHDKYFFGSDHFAAEYVKQKEKRYLAGSCSTCSRARMPSTRSSRTHRSGPGRSSRTSGRRPRRSA